MKLKNIKSNFTMVPNEWFRSGLSMKAVGLLALLQSLPDDWNFTIAGLKKLTKDGKSSIQTALNELKEAGFVVCKQVKDENGHFSHNEMELKVRNSADGKPVDCFLVTGKNDTINNIYNKEINNKDILSKDSIGETPKNDCKNVEIDELFDEWESAFEYRPRDTKANRYAAYNLLRNKNIGKEKVRGIIKVLPKLQMQTYCVGSVKKVSDFVSLQREWDTIWNMAFREWKRQQESKVVQDWRL